MNTIVKRVSYSPLIMGLYLSISVAVWVGGWRFRAMAFPELDDSAQTTARAQSFLQEQQKAGKPTDDWTEQDTIMYWKVHRNTPRPESPAVWMTQYRSATAWSNRFTEISLWMVTGAVVTAWLVCFWGWWTGYFPWKGGLVYALAALAMIVLWKTAEGGIFQGFHRWSSRGWIPLMTRWAYPLVDWTLKAGICVTAARILIRHKGLALPVWEGRNSGPWWTPYVAGLAVALLTESLLNHGFYALGSTAGQWWGWGEAWPNLLADASSSALAACWEESVFRLLGSALCLWIFKREWTMWLIPGVIWAFAHGGGGPFPFFVNAASLLGYWVLSQYLFLTYGFLAVWIWHYLVNIVYSATLAPAWASIGPWLLAVLLPGIMLWMWARVRGSAPETTPLTPQT